MIRERIQSNSMAPSPSPRNGTTSLQATPTRTPNSRSRLNFMARPSISPSPNNINPPPNAILSTEHPVEIVGRIRDYPERKEKQTAIQLLPNGTTVRVRTELGYRDFSLDGVSVGETDGLETFYKKFVEPRVNGVKTGGKCTVMMYGPTGSGKSHTMFGCANEPGIVYRALHDILGDYSGQDGREDGVSGNRFKVKVTVLEIYNEEIYDLLATNASSGFNVGWSKNTGCRVRLEVMGKKVKNAMFISGNDAGKIAKEVAKVEKRRVVKSTVCNERSSRSHCLITLDVPAVGGRLMLVDMAGSENIDQAGLGFEAKMQTGKINQGNVALKRVVEAIANGDSHVPFRDSKLTMLLQDSFEDDGAKILMVLCASPDPRDIHKTIGTLEYGAKAKCIVRCSNSPSKEKVNSQDIASTLLGARIVAMDEYISKLQLENQLKDKEREAAQRELLKKEQEVAELKAKLEEMQEKQSEAQEKIVSKVEEKARLLKLELLRKFEECERSANIFVELGKRKMEEKILQQQEEVEMLRLRLEEIESELQHMKSNPASDALQGTDANMEIEKTSEIGEAGELVASSARFLEGMQACVQQMKDKYMSPQDEVHKFSSRSVSEGGIHLNGHVEVIPGNEKSLYSLGAVDESDKENLEDSNASYKPKLDYKASLGEDSSMMDLSDQFNNSLDPVNKDERVLIHQRFPFLRSITTGNCGNDHQYGDVEEEREEEDPESTSFMRRGQLPTVYEEEEEDIMEGDGIHEDTSDKGIISNVRSHIQSDFVEARIVNGCSTEGKTVEGHFEPNSQGEIFLKDCSNPAMEKKVTEGKYDNWAGKLAKPVTNSDTNICHGNVGDRLLGTQALEKDPTDFRKTRIQNIFFLCGNYRELARQARNPSPEEKPDPMVNIHDETPKEAAMGCFLNLPGSSNLNSTTSLEEPAVNLSPEVAGLVSPALKTFSPRESKVISLSSSPDGSRKQDFRSPRRAPSRVIEAGASMPESLNMDTQIPTLTDVNPASSSFHTLQPGLPHRDGQTEQLIGIKEDQIQEDQKEKCDVYVKWETSKEASGKLIQILKMQRNANLADLRRMIEPYLRNTERDFIFLMLGDPSGAPVSREKEAGVQVTSLPDCHNQRGSRLACLRLPPKRSTMMHSPFNSLDNKLPLLSPSPSSTTTNSPGHVSSCGSGSPLFAGRRPITRMGNSNLSMDSGGKTGQKVGGSGALLKGLRL